MSEQDKQCREAFEALYGKEPSQGADRDEWLLRLTGWYNCYMWLTGMQITVTKNESGQIVAVTRTDAEGKILEVIAESAPQAQFTDEAFEKLFEQFADLYNQESNEWLDMDVQTAFVAGCKAIAARCGGEQAKEKAEMFDWLMHYMSLDDVGDDNFVLGLNIDYESLSEDVTAHAHRLYLEKNERICEAHYKGNFEYFEPMPTVIQAIKSAMQKEKPCS